MDYRGEIGIIINNPTYANVLITHHDRIAQMLIEPTYTIDFKVVDHLNETDRGEGGFGSTGK